MIERLGLVALLGCLATAGAADPVCTSDRFEGVPYTACVIDPAADEIGLYYRKDEGSLIGSFSDLGSELARDGKSLRLAMNGGMYHPDRRPVGLYIENGVEISPIVLSEGPGNFGLLPNGVFCLHGTRARVIESRRFDWLEVVCDFATQSGPLMVENGWLHPRFLPESDSLFIRNGVGVRPDGKVVFAISDAPLNFHRFARLFRDKLGTPDALYIDGRVSRLHAPEIGRSDFGLPMGPILAVTRPAD